MQADFFKKETICFHSKENIKNNIIGIGVDITYYYESETIKFINTQLGLLSYKAFVNENVRKDVWRHKIDNFIPLYINKEHGEKAMELFEKQIAKIYKKDFEPQLALNFCCSLMNTFVVNLMNGEKHASINALTGYCYFHRILLYFSEKYESIKKYTNDKIKKFIENSSERNKANTPNLGELFPLLLISDYKWHEVAPKLIQEGMSRNVYWIIKKYPELKNLSVNKNERITKSFKSSLVSKKLIMFHYYCLKIVCKNEQLISDYEKYYGRPSEKFVNEFQKKVFTMQKLSSYQEFFEYVDITSNLNIYQILIKSIKNSNKSGYTEAKDFYEKNKSYQKIQYSKN